MARLFDQTMYRLLLLAGLFCSFLIGSTAIASPRKGEMVTWGTFQFIRSVGASLSHAYFATTDGLIRYNKLERRWEDPLTGADGLGQSQIRQIWPSRFDDRLSAQLDQGYAEYDLFFDRWYLRDDKPELDTIYSIIRTPMDFIPPMNFNYFSNGSIADMVGRSVSVSTVAEDNTGDLWIGTWGFGPAWARGGTKDIEFLPCGLLNSRVDVILPVDTELYLGGLLEVDSRAGLTVFHPDGAGTSYIEGGVVPGFGQVDITALAVDDDHLFVGTPYGLTILTRDGSRAIQTLGHKAGLPDDSITCLRMVSDSLFIGTLSGLCVWRRDTIWSIAPKTFAKSRIFDILPEGDNLWIASEWGAFRLNRKTGELARYADPAQFTAGRVYGFALAGSNLWMSADNGLLKINLKTAQVEPIRLNLLPRVARPVVANHRIAATITDHGVVLVHHDRANPISRDFTVADGLPSDRIHALYLDGDYIWIGSDKGLTRFWWNNPDRVD
jgi:ligand-binding sensor domain-containing protein